MENLRDGWVVRLSRERGGEPRKDDDEEEKEAAEQRRDTREDGGLRAPNEGRIRKGEPRGVTDDPKI